MEGCLKASFIANESIGAYRVVAMNASASARNMARVELWDTSTCVAPVGIIQDAVSTNGACDVVILGKTRGQCGDGSVSAGALLRVETATGLLVEGGANTITTQIVGIALENGQTNGVISVLYLPNLIPNA